MIAQVPSSPSAVHTLPLNQIDTSNPPSEPEPAFKKRWSSAPEPAVETQPPEYLSFWSTDPKTQITTMQGLHDKKPVRLTAEIVYVTTPREVRWMENGEIDSVGRNRIGRWCC